MSRQDATSTGNTVMSHHLMITLAYIQRPLAPALTADTSFKRMRESSLSNNGTFSSKLYPLGFLQISSYKINEKILAIR